MRMGCVLVLAILLAGCTDSNWSGIVGGSGDPPPNSAPPTAAAADVSPDSDHKCQWAAKERANDAAVQGFESDVQRADYEKTYADCLHWAAKIAR